MSLSSLVAGTMETISIGTQMDLSKTPKTTNSPRTIRTLGICCIDHDLGKEINGEKHSHPEIRKRLFFGATWNRNQIDNVQISFQGAFEVQFGSTDFSDVTLHILERAQSPHPVVVALARSPNFRRLMETVKVPGSTVVKLEIGAKYFDILVPDTTSGLYDECKSGERPRCRPSHDALRCLWLCLSIQPRLRQL